MHSLTLTLTLTFTLKNDTERCIRRWRRGDKSIWCVAVDVAADAAVAVAVTVAATTIFLLLLSVDGGKVIRIALTTRECNVRVVSRGNGLLALPISRKQEGRRYIIYNV